MKHLLIPALAVGFTTIASADAITSITAQAYAPAKSWIDDVLPPGASKPLAIGTHNCLDQYPADAKAVHVEGITSLSYRIAEDGSVKQITIRTSSGNATLDKAAIGCVKAWTYTPAMLDGKPIDIAWRNDVKWVITTNPLIAWPPAPSQPMLVNAAPPPPPPVNLITTQAQAANPPPIASPASMGKPHVCLAMYPPDAVAERAQGTVTVQFSITTEGTTHGNRVVRSSGYAALDDAAVACTCDWRYKPAMKDGQPVEVPWKAEVRWLMH